MNPAISPPEAPKSRWVRLGVGLVLALTACAVALLGLELVLRWSGSQRDSFFQLDAEVGAEHIPGKKGWHVFAEGRQHIAINAHGYRDQPRQLEKPPGTLRIAVLGDSFVEAFQVALEETFASRLEAALNGEPPAGCGGRRFEVLNFGVSGFGTGQELETLRRRVATFAPDVVLLYLFPGNDLFDNHRPLDLEPNRLHFSLDEQGELVRLPYTVRDNAVKSWLRQHSRAYAFLRDRIKKLAALRRALTAARLMQDHKTEPTRPRRSELLDERYRTPLPPQFEQAWRLTEKLLAEVARETAAQDAAFGLVVIPTQEEILDRSKKPSPDSASLDYQQPLGRVRAICQRHDWRCLPLVDAFRRAPGGVEELYFPIDLHWTPQGHAVAAAATHEWLAPWLCAEAGR